MKVGVIGLGNMGAPMAANLIKGGHEVTVYNRSKDKAEPLVKLGAKLAETPAEAAQGDAFITMLSNDSVVEKILFDTANGVIAKQGKETIHISTSTISPALSRKIAEESHSKGVPYISSCVLGRPDVAERGELVCMVGGDSSLIEKCEPALKSISKKILVLGSTPEQANIAKVAANYMISAMIQTFGEAFALVEKGGVDKQKFYEMVAFDFFNSPVYQKYGKIIVEQNYKGEAFTITGQAKDTKLAADCARELACPMPFLSVLDDAFLSAIARGKGDMDPCAIAQVAAENAGLKTTKNLD